MFAKRVEKYNIKYCDVLAAAKAGQRLLKAVNWIYWIIYLLHCQHFSLLEVFLFTSLLFYMMKVNANVYKRFKTRFLVRTCMYREVLHNLKCSNNYPFTLNSFLLWGVVKFHFFLCQVHRGRNLLFNETQLFILFTMSSEAFTDICMITRFLFHHLACTACTLYQLI